MSDSKDTNELDSYGVWVKTPPKTVDSSGENKTTENLDDFNLDTDLPDFSDLDVVDEPQPSDFDSGETALSSKELSAIEGDAAPAVSSHPVNENGEEEISLDEFLDGGVFETGPDEDKIKEKEAAGLASPHEEAKEDSAEKEAEKTELPIEDDSTTPVTEDAVEQDNTQDQGTQGVDDDIFNIDLSFDDGTQTASDNGGETFSSDIAETAPASSSPAGTEDVDLSEFGLDDLNTDDNIPTDVSTETHDSSAGSTEMESIDLSEFGFDDTDSSDTAAEENTSPDEQKASENEIPEPETVLDTDDTDTSIDLDLPDSPEHSDINEEIPSESEASIQADTPNESIPAQDSAETDAPVIPDTFDEEASALLDDSEQTEISDEDEKTAEFADSIKAPILDETVAEEEKPSTQMTAIFSQIVSELSSLKNEIAALKNDFEKIKNLPQNTATLDTPEPKEESDGFFSSTDDDETIALSTDELDNILNNADITAAPSDEKAPETTPSEEAVQTEPDTISQPQEEPILDSGEPSEEDFPEPAVFDTDFASDEESEPEDVSTLDTADETEEAEPSEELPEEISVPRTDDILSDDILVESSPSDLIEDDSGSDKADDTETSGVLEDIQDEQESEPSLESSESSTEEDPFAVYENPDPSISDTLTDEKIDYLEASPEASSEEPEEKPEEKKSGISTDMTDEIKSVLSYMDQLLENLPEEKIEEFARSEQFDTYKKLFKELGLA